MVSAEVDVVIEAAAILGEGPVWTGDSLWWVDIEGQRIHRTDPATGRDQITQMDDPIGAVIPRVQGGWVAGLSNGVVIVAPDGAEEHRIPVEPDDIESRMNDAKCDPPPAGKRHD
jgi:sugar lactone lactonase YvrE